MSAGVVDIIIFIRTSNLAINCSKSSRYNFFYSSIVLVRSAKVVVIIKFVQVKSFAFFLQELLQSFCF